MSVMLREQLRRSVERESTPTERALRRLLYDLGIRFNEFIAQIDVHESLGFHEACEAALFELGKPHLVREPLLTQLARATADHYAGFTFDEFAAMAREITK